MVSRMKARRFIAGLSQDELMIQTGINQAKISRIERGYLKPSKEERQKLAEALGVSPEELFQEA